jgi:hypothetical protein
MKIEVETNAVVQTTHALVEALAALKKAERVPPEDKRGLMRFRRVGISVDPR